MWILLTIANKMLFFLMPSTCEMILCCGKVSLLWNYIQINITANQIRGEVDIQFVLGKMSE